jgi:zinc transporter 1/2/3
MRTTIPLLTALAVSLAHAQRTTYTGCHNDSENGAEVEYCFGPDGVESARATYAVSGTATLPASAPASATGAAQTTAVTACRRQDAAVLCTNGANAEVRVEATPTGPIPAQYTGCHSHGAEQCVSRVRLVSPRSPR